MVAIAVRHAEPGDAEALQHIYAQVEVYRDTLQLPHPSLRSWAERIDNLPPGTRNLIACIDGQVVGQVMLWVEQSPRRSHVASFGIGVDRRFQGKGVASTLLKEVINLCDNWLRIDRIEITVYTDNAPALALYRKFGFEQEGVGKNYALRDGKYVDALFMARLKPHAADSA